MEPRLIEYDEVVGKATYQKVISYHPELDILFRLRSRLPGPVEINGINPVLHVMLEMNAAGLVDDPEFPHARQAMERLLSAGLGEHACLCAIGRLISFEIHSAFSELRADNDRFRRRLGLLSPHRRKAPGRNEPCPCGSGLKFKKCCSEVFSGFTVGPMDGELRLGIGAYVLHREPVSTPFDIKLSRLENRQQIAEYLGCAGLLDESLAVLKENHEETKVVLPDMERNALQDIVSLCYDHPLLSATGIEYSRLLLDSESSRPSDDWDTLTIRCDMLDMIGRAHGSDEGESGFQGLLSEFPDNDFILYRKALYLIEHDRREEAKPILVQVGERGNARYSGEAAEWARNVLEDEFGPDGPSGSSRGR